MRRGVATSSDESWTSSECSTVAECILTFRQILAHRDSPSHGIKRARLYWLSDQHLSGKRVLARQFLAVRDVPEKNIKRGRLYLTYGCGGGCPGCTLPPLCYCVTGPGCGNCELSSPLECAEIGGTCQAGECPDEPGACCLYSNEGNYSGCVVVCQSVCTLQGGDYHGDGTTCSPDICE